MKKKTIVLKEIVKFQKHLYGNYKSKPTHNFECNNNLTGDSNCRTNPKNPLFLCKNRECPSESMRSCPANRCNCFLAYCMGNRKFTTGHHPSIRISISPPQNLEPCTPSSILTLMHLFAMSLWG